MKKNAFLLARVAGLFIAAALLASCYAQLADQKGYLNLGLQFAEGSRVMGTPQVIVLVVNSGYQDSLAEMLNLIGKGNANSGNLPGSDQDRLKTLGKQLSTSGLVNFGGFPFYQTTMSGSSGSFQIPGVPGGRDYFVKLFVLNQGVSFSVQNIDENFYSLIQSENLVFNTETYTSDTAWQLWKPASGQPVVVNAGQSTAVNVTLGSVPY